MPESPPRNVDQLRSRIDAGQQADKVSASDPAAAPLGTDDEAAGVSTSEAELSVSAPPRPGCPPIRALAASTRAVRMVIIVVIVLAIALALFFGLR